jgi:hypothetical protein
MAARPKTEDFRNRLRVSDMGAILRPETGTPGFV